jgi:hypothetical protein
MINLHSFAVSSSTPSHTRGCPTPRPTRETRVVPETWLLSYSISCYRWAIGPRRTQRSTGNRRAKCDKRVSRGVSRRNLFCQLRYNPTCAFVGLIYLSVSSIFPISPNMWIESETGLRIRMPQPKECLQVSIRRYTPIATDLNESQT